MLRNLQPPASPFSCKAVFNYPPQLIFSPPFQITNPWGMQAEKNNFLTFFLTFESIRIISFGLSFFRRQIAPNYRWLIVYAHLGRFNTTRAGLKELFTPGFNKLWRVFRWQVDKTVLHRCECAPLCWRGVEIRACERGVARDPSRLETTCALKV